MIIYSAEALADLVRLRAVVEALDPRLGRRFAEILAKSEAQIARRPLAHPAVESGVARKCLMRFGRSTYIIYFQVEDANQIILHVWHGREQRT